jgi:hypothetical protein
MWRAAADAGLMYGKAVLIGDTVKGTSVSLYLYIFMTYLKLSTWSCLELRMQDKVTVSRLIIVPFKGWNSSDI